MQYVIGVNPNRSVRKASNRGVSKYAQVRSDKTFGWLVGSPTQAPAGVTIFADRAKANQALGARARALPKGNLTSDVHLFPVTAVETVSVAKLGPMENGH